MPDPHPSDRVRADVPVVELDSNIRPVPGENPAVEGADGDRGGRVEMGGGEHWVGGLCSCHRKNMRGERPA